MAGRGGRRSASSLLLALAVASVSYQPANTSYQPANTLFDLSGLGWMGNLTFVAVNDAKNPDELEKPRVLLLTLTESPEGLLWKAVEDLDWPDSLGKPSDLESASVIPGTLDILIAESGDDGSKYQRIFLLRYDGEDGLKLVGNTTWPQPVFNVEASAVASIDGGFLFAYAERADGEPSTEIKWTSFYTEDLTFGDFSSVQLQNPDLLNSNRPIVGMDFDSQNVLYIVSSFDPDEDNGPYSSSVWRIGRLESGSGEQEPEIVLEDPPHRIATVDGFKVESVAIDHETGRIYIGTDDENLGNVLRPLRDLP